MENNEIITRDEMNVAQKTRDEFMRLPVREAIRKAAAIFKCADVDEDLMAACFRKEWVKHFLYAGSANFRTFADYIEGKLEKVEDIERAQYRLRKTQNAMNLYEELKSLNLPILFLTGYNRAIENPMTPEIQADFYNGTELYSEYGKEGKKVFQKGKHKFITCQDEIMTRKFIERVKLAKTEDPEAFIHLFVTNDTIVVPKLAAELYEAGGDIVKAGRKWEEIDRYIGRLKVAYQQRKINKDVSYIDYAKEKEKLLALPIEEILAQKLDVKDEIEVEAFQYAVTDERIRQFVAGDGDLNDLYNFLNGDRSKIDELAGREFNTYYYNELKKMNGENVKCEVHKDNTSADVVARLNGNESFNIRERGEGQKVREVSYEPEDHAFELKANTTLRADTIEAAGRLKYYFDNVHVVILRTTKVEDDVFEGLNKLNVDIIETPITKKVLIDRIDGIKAEFIKKRTELEVKAKFKYKLYEEGLNIDDAKADQLVDIVGSEFAEQMMGHNICFRTMIIYLMDKGELFDAPKYLAQTYMLHFKANSETVELLKQSSAERIRVIGNGGHFDDRRMNVVARINPKAVFTKIMPNGDIKEEEARVENSYWKDHCFITNHKSTVSENLLHEISKVKQKFANVHVVLLEGTTISPKLIKAIYDQNIDIIISKSSEHNVKEGLRTIRVEAKKLFKE